jgi:hypothetical protein
MFDGWSEVLDVHVWGMSLDVSRNWIKLAWEKADWSDDGAVVLICILKNRQVTRKQQFWVSKWQQSHLEAATKTAAIEGNHLLFGT